MIYKPAIERMVKNWNESADMMTTINEETIRTLPDSVGSFFDNSVPQLMRSPQNVTFWLVDLKLPSDTVVPDDLRDYALAINNSTGLNRTRIRFQGRIWDYQLGTD